MKFKEWHEKHCPIVKGGGRPCCTFTWQVSTEGTHQWVAGDTCGHSVPDHFVGKTCKQVYDERPQLTAESILKELENEYKRTPFKPFTENSPYYFDWKTDYFAMNYGAPTNTRDNSPEENTMQKNESIIIAEHLRSCATAAANRLKANRRSLEHDDKVLANRRERLAQVQKNLEALEEEISALSGRDGSETLARLKDELPAHECSVESVEMEVKATEKSIANMKLRSAGVVAEEAALRAAYNAHIAKGIEAPTFEPLEAP